MAVSFSATASPATAVLTWDFGDQTATSNGNSVTHTYTNTTDATFTVTVTAGANGTNTSQTLKYYRLRARFRQRKRAYAEYRRHRPNPVDGTSVTVVGSNGGVMQLQVDVNGGAVPAGDTVTTNYLDAKGNVVATVKGRNRSTNLRKPGIYVAAVTLTDAAGNPAGMTASRCPSARLKRAPP